MKKGILLAASLVVAGGIAADAQSITGDDVARMRDRFRGDPSVVAIQNVLTSNGDIRALALNHGLDGKVDHYFKYRVNVKGITDQKQSGRCWMFTSMNVLRPSVMEKYNLDEFDFSHNYLYLKINIQTQTYREQIRIPQCQIFTIEIINLIYRKYILRLSINLKFI